MQISLADADDGVWSMEADITGEGYPTMTVVYPSVKGPRSQKNRRSD